MSHPENERRTDSEALEPIVPAAFDEPEQHATPLPFGRPSQLQRVVVISAAILLFFAVLSVIFVLPRYVGTPATQPTPDVADQNVREKPQETAVAKLEIPEEEARQLRRENQAQLQDLITRTGALKDKNVTQWAKTEFSAILDGMELGEQAYREQRYHDASEQYGDALANVAQLESRAVEVLRDAIDEGFLQIANGQSASAKKAFELALSIDSNNEEARSGLRRATTLDQVLALINEAQGYQDLGDSDAALERYQQALQLDDKAPGAAAAIAQIEGARLDAKFNTSMSAGLAAFDRGADSKARAAFKQALKIKPGAKDAKSALAQVENRILVNQISNHLGRARGFEEAEQWASAAAEYRKAAALDSDLQGAASSALKADRRAKLDAQLEKTIAAPERLSDDTVHREATAILARAKAVPEAGPRLNSQISRLATAITRARTPVEVTLVSDEATEVTLYKVGNLGQFLKRSVSVLPGRYVAVGRRNGFRDVRVEFNVEPANGGKSVTVRCEQELAFGR